jgi:hypothetical protein
MEKLWLTWESYSCILENIEASRIEEECTKWNLQSVKIIKREDDK